MKELYKTDSDETTFHRGKIREIYEVSDEYLAVINTDRIDLDGQVFPNSVTGKGIFLNRLTNLWLDILNMPSHRVSMGSIPKENLIDFVELEDEVQDRVMVVKKAEPLKVRVVIMKHLNGFAWDEYFEHGTICGVEFQDGLNHKDLIPSGPIAIPFTETSSGLLEMITPDQALEVLEEEWNDILTMSFDIFNRASKILEKKDIALAHSEFSYGLIDGTICLIGDILTPDNTCYWFKNTSEIVNRSYEGFDRQILENWYRNLDTEAKTKSEGLPRIPSVVSEKIIDKYKELLYCLSNVDK